MKLVHAEWRGRIDHWKRALIEDFYEPAGEIRWEAFFTMEHLSLEEVGRQRFAPVEPGFTWGRSWEYGWFRGRVVLPEGLKGARVVMNLAPGGESTIFVNGKTFGTYRKKASWPPVTPWEFFEDNALTERAQGGEEFQILVETYAGHFVPEKIGPILREEDIRDPLTEGARVTLGRATFGAFNEEAYQLYMDVDTLDRLYGALDERSLRAMRVGRGLMEFTRIVDFEQPPAARIESYRRAREALKPLMEAKNGSTMPRCYAIGQSHLDLAWLWPFEETHRKTARTFAGELRLLEKYPDYKFLMTQPAAYEMCRKYYPDVFEGIKAAVRRGQWIPEGALWVEPDLNLVSGEALVRQFLYGKRYYKEEFGVDSEILWVPDTFGYNAAIPQIMRQCGVKYFMTQKLLWNYNDSEKFPYFYFNWKGIDGSGVTSLFTYFELPFPDSVASVWNRAGQSDMDAFLVPFGYGDGGGGSTRDQVEYCLRQKDLEGTPPVEIESPVELFHRLDELGGPENTYDGELYLAVHRGTLTTHGLVKKNNRRAEIALREMELWSSLALGKGQAYDAARAERIWKELLLNQFHDVLPGSSIQRVYAYTHKAVQGVIDEAAEMGRAAMDCLAEPCEGAVTVFNSLSFPRQELVSLPESFRNGAVTGDGRPVPAESGPEGARAIVSLPPCGAATLFPAKEPMENGPFASVWAEGDGFRLENDKISARIDGRGQVVSFVRRATGREFAGGAMNRLRLFKDIPRDCDAWDIDITYEDMETDGAFDIRVEAAGEGLEAAVKVTGRISRSSFTQYIRLRAGDDALRFDTELDWHEIHRLLKVDFTTDVFAQNAINEIQFGFVERPTHKSRQYDRDRFEVCNHRYSALQDGSHGAAVLNDCKYGISMSGSTLSLTLMRAPVQPQLRPDEGRHAFTYAFMGWEGGFVESEAARRAYALNAPAQVTVGRRADFSALSIDAANVLLDTMKPAEDGSGDVILRLYECKKAPVTARVRGDLIRGRRAYLCDMLENIQEELSVEDGVIAAPFRAFEIKTIRIR